MRRDVGFRSEGVDLSAWLYGPDSSPPWALVVMAHGDSATRRMTADKFAEAFRAAGLAVLLYDHRGFGDSAGEPRVQINPWVQARGYRDGVSYASALREIDATKIGLWGHGSSGASALAVAAVDRRVAALSIQVPALGAELPPDDPDGSLLFAFEETILAAPVEPSGPDEIEGPMPVVSDDPVRRRCALTPLTAYRWFIEHGGRFGSRWVNDVTRAHPKTGAPWHPGLAAPDVSCPAQFIVSKDDEVSDARPSVSRAIYDRLGTPSARKEWLGIDGGHFGLLHVPSPEFDRASRAQARFLVEHLAPPTAPRSLSPSQRPPPPK